MSWSSTLVERGAVLTEVDAVLTPAKFGDLATEVAALRRSVAVSAMPHVSAVRVSGPGTYELLDRVCPAELFIRDGSLRQALLLREDGTVLADVYLCNDDDDFILLAEGASTEALVDHLRAHATPSGGTEITDLGQTHTLLSLNGPFAWELLAALEEPDVIGFPYLSFYHPARDRTYFRAGKTGEFGYDLLVPEEQAALWLERLLEEGRRFDVALAGVEALWHCQLENWFFNPYREGSTGLTPLELQLQWRVSYKKDYVGAKALAARKAAGSAPRVVPVQADGALAAGDEVWFDGAVIGTILHAARALTLELHPSLAPLRGRHFAAALLDHAYAHSGIDRYHVRRGGEEVPVRTVSAPLVNNLSLYVNPQKHDYQTRDEIAYPGPLRNP